MLIVIWRREVTLEGVTELKKIGSVFAQAGNGQRSCLTIVQSTSPPPSDKVRSPFASFHREIAPHMKEQIVVAEGSGFRSALVRSIGVALSTISPKSLPFKFATGLDEAAALLQPHLSPAAGGAEGLKRALIDVRARLT